MKPTTDFPFLLDNPRAWRTYLGGRMLDALHGDSNGEDGHFPEEWILSTVAARNAGREQFPEEGMSHLRGTDVTLKSVLESEPEGYLGKGAAQPTLGVLTKLIDSAERLTLQVHPDRPTALRLFQSQYGKTECWHILSGHPVNGEEPCIYYGFQPDMTRARWEALFHAQDIPGMLAGMQKYPVHPGDTILIEGGMPHAIGAGCMLLEAQEPTDFTIQPEYWCGEYHLNAQEMYLGLPAETALECFDFTRYGQRVVEQSRKIPRVLREAPGLRVECLIGPEDTSCFSMTRYCLTDGTAALDVPASIWICIEGSGEVTGENYRRALHRGDYFFLPAAAEGYALHGENLQIVCCMGGK